MSTSSGASIEKIINGTYDKHNVSVLYASKIETTDNGKFLSFRSTVRSDVSNVDSNISEARSLLQKTNSKRFTDPVKMQILTNVETDNNTLLGKIENKALSRDVEQMLSVINNYNSKLATAKKVVRRNLLVKESKSIILENIYVTSYEVKITSYFDASPTYEKNLYVIYYSYLKTTDVKYWSGTPTKKYSATKYYYLQYDNLTTAELEKYILMIRGRLPYDKARIQV